MLIIKVAWLLKIKSCTYPRIAQNMIKTKTQINQKQIVTRVT